MTSESNAFILTQSAFEAVCKERDEARKELQAMREANKGAYLQLTCASPRSAFGATHHHGCACREKAIMEILVLVEPIMEAWAQSHELDEWHCRVEDLIGTAHPSLMYLPNDQGQPRAEQT